ncbi:MAG: SpoIID/LytB domain-containing protein [bacterium]
MRQLITLCLSLLCLLAIPAGRAHAAAGQQIRVVLDDSSASARIKGNLQWRTSSEKLAGSEQPGEVSISGSQLKLSLDGKSYTSSRFFAEPLQGYVQYEGRGYRGHIELFVGQSGKVVVLNVLSLEDYLCGVVPAEMSPSWPFEALKSQAVAARTYAMSRILANLERSYDVYGNVSDQAYKGLSGEHDNSNRAVLETAGQVLEYDGRIITAFYCACAGGMTKQGSEPYLRSVPTDHPDSPHHGWTVQLSLEELSRLVKESGAEIGPIKDVTVEYDAYSGHLLSLIVHGANNSKQLYGTTLRKLIGRSTMKSTRCRIYPAGTEPAPLIASAPASAAPAAPEITRDVNSATEVSIDGLSFTAEDGSFSTRESYGWLKPWVASADMQVTVKMRGMYAYDGSSLMQCNRDMHMLSAQSESTLAGFGEADAPVRDTDDPVSQGDVLPDQKIVNARMSRTEMSGGLVIRGDGYGHGIGMSQWGARKLAEDGMDYSSILRYFYTGVAIVSMGNSAVQPGEQRSTAAAEATSEFYEPFTEVDLK